MGVSRSPSTEKASGSKSTWGVGRIRIWIGPRGVGGLAPGPGRQQASLHSECPGLIGDAPPVQPQAPLPALRPAKPPHRRDALKALELVRLCRRVELAQDPGARVGVGTQLLEGAFGRGSEGVTRVDTGRHITQGERGSQSKPC